MAKSHVKWKADDEDMNIIVLLTKQQCWCDWGAIFTSMTMKTVKISHLCSTSFGQKYGHFIFFGKQMDIFEEKVYIFRKVTSAPTFLA